MGFKQYPNHADFIRVGTSTSAIKSKSKAKGIGFVDGKLYVNTGSGATLLSDAIASTATSVGTVPATVTAAEYGVGGFLHKTVLTFAATSVSVADSAAAGSTLVYTFPEGAITFLGGSFSLAPTTTSTIASTLKSGVTIEVGLGTATAAGALTTTEENIIDGATGPSSTTINVAAAAIVGVKTAAPSIVDGHSSAAVAYLNIGVPTATDIDADATVTVTGTATFLWLFGGDV